MKNSAKGKSTRGKVLSHNRKATFNYKIEDTFEAGIALIGEEVKSSRLGGANIADAYVGFDSLGMVLFNMNISTYKYAQKNLTTSYDPTRNRRLLLHKKEITKIQTRIKQKGGTVIPLKLYFNRRQKIKIEIAIAVGKKTHDKRATIKERDLAREARKENF
ncbi:MAG: SsrA-binding protein SmpB [Alphaproteobacteria bacterium]|nr:SsrA-binding protein SmpB [Rickettsiales bacterium]